jgi:Schlafen, AlbA_2
VIIRSPTCELKRSADLWFQPVAFLHRLHRESLSKSDILSRASLRGDTSWFREVYQGRDRIARCYFCELRLSIFTTPISQLTFADLEELRQEGAVENTRLEFKREVPDKDETLKKLSSFANTFGGFMVVGAKADSKDGRLLDLSGVDPQNGYKQKVVQWCFDGASPPLIVEVSDPIPVTGQSSKVCYVVAIAESDTAPHFVNGRKGVWVRTDEFSARFEAQFADEIELRYLFDRRKLILERKNRLLNRAKGRFDTYVSRKHTDLGGNQTKVGPLLQMSVIPRFPSRQLRQQRFFHDHILKLHTQWRGTIFPDFTRRQFLWQDESVIVLDATVGTSYLEATVWGSMFYGVEIDTAHTHAGIDGIHPCEVVGYLLLFIDHAGKILNAAGYSGPLSIQFAMSAIVGVPWLQIQYGGFVLAGAKSELDNEIIFTFATTIEEILAHRDDVVWQVVERLFCSVNWPNAVGTDENRKNLMSLAYRYNSWPG